MNLGRGVLDSVERLQEPESLRLEVELKLMEGPLTDVIGAVRRTLSKEKMAGLETEVFLDLKLLLFYIKICWTRIDI